ncbi:MAG: hypothetical protein JXR91_13970 [Deltaproteobacteria bacterium]|nr:hypothetical protein [Deltaproteobacteria bacterium]
MIESLKEKAISKGIKLLNSPVVAKAMESEQVGQILEKAMSLPIKVSEKLSSNKEKIVSFMELVTSEDLDELKRTIVNLEDEVSKLKEQAKSSKKKK